MAKLIYEFATKSHSARVHQLVYGSRSRIFKPADLDTQFKFECKRLGNCCRGRALAANIVTGQSQVVPIRNYARDNGIAVKGIESDELLWLDGLDPAVRSVGVASMRLHGLHTGLSYVGPHGHDCQFLNGDLCAIHPVKPIHCRLAPVGWILEHEDFGGKIALAFQLEKWTDCAACCDGPTRTIREWLDNVITNEYLNEIRRCSGWPIILR